MKCNKCGKELKEGARFCTNCGNKVEVSLEDVSQSVNEKVAKEKITSAHVICPHCGAMQQEGIIFCTVCGEKIDYDSTQPKTEAVQNVSTEDQATTVLDDEQTATVSQDEEPTTVLEETTQSEQEEEATTILEQENEETMQVEEDKTVPFEEKQSPDNQNENRIKCPHCGASLKSGAKFCTSCGKSVNESVKTIPVTLEQQKNVCPYCGAELREGAEFCTSCGKNIKKKFNLDDKKKTMLFGIILAVLIVVVGILVYFAFIKEDEPTACVSGGGSWNYDTETCTTQTTCEVDGGDWNSSTSTCVTESACTADGNIWNSSTHTCQTEQEACEADANIWDEDSESCMTQSEYEEKQEKEAEQEEKEACEADGKSWNSSSKTCETSVGGYTPGTYVTNYDGMRIRSGASTSSSVVKENLSKGTTVTITEVSKGSSDSNSIWGKVSNGWICIKDSSMTYLSKQ